MPFETGTVVLVDIEPMTPLNSDSFGPCFVKSLGPVNGAYKRVADQNLLLTHQESYSIHSRWMPREFDAERIEGMRVQDLDDALIEALFVSVRSSGSRALDRTDSDNEKLTRLKITDQDSGVTLAGGLTFGAYPQQFLPRLIVDVTAHLHRTKDAVGQTRFLDRQVCDGPIPYMVQDALKRTMSNLKNVRIVRGSVGIDEPEIPEDVLREAITNAVMHRDYSPFAWGERISIDIYPDRVEVVSPGGLIGDRTAQNIGDGKSVARNPSLANLLRMTPIPQQAGVLAESQGSGIPRMESGMRQRGLPQPDFHADLVSVKVVLHRHGLMDHDTRIWLDSLPGGNTRNPVNNLALAYLQQRGETTVQELRTELGYDSDDIRHVLGDLMSDGLIEGSGDGPFALTHGSGHSKHHEDLTNLEREIYEILNETQAKSIREIAEELGRTVGSLRPILRNLVDAGRIEPTAPPQSRNRAYLRLS